MKGTDYSRNDTCDTSGTYIFFYAATEHWRSVARRLEMEILTEGQIPCGVWTMPVGSGYLEPPWDFSPSIGHTREKKSIGKRVKLGPLFLE